MRIALGAVMIVHGYPKVTGIHNVEKFFSSIGLPWWSAYLSAGAEFFGGILIIIGLLTRPVAFAQLIDMIVAIAKVHWKHGLAGEGNYQLPLTLAALAPGADFLWRRPHRPGRHYWPGPRRKPKSGLCLKYLSMLHPALQPILAR